MRKSPYRPHRHRRHRRSPHGGQRGVRVLDHHGFGLGHRQHHHRRDQPARRVLPEEHPDRDVPGRLLSAPPTTTVHEQNATENSYVATVKGYITRTSKAGCTGDDFLLGGTAGANDDGQRQGPDLDRSGPGQERWPRRRPTSTVQFNNITGANQDACKSATVTIHYLGQLIQPRWAEGDLAPNPPTQVPRSMHARRSHGNFRGDDSHEAQAPDRGARRCCRPARRRRRRSGVLQGVPGVPHHLQRPGRGHDEPHGHLLLRRTPQSTPSSAGSTA